MCVPSPADVSVRTFTNERKGTMRLYTYYTPSHKVFLENWMVPSLPEGLDVRLCVDDTQHCESGSFRTEGWRETQIKKVGWWLQAIEECDEGEIFIGSDVDVQWFLPVCDFLERSMKGIDFAIQGLLKPNAGAICSGFFVCRATSTTKDMWKSVLDDLLAGTCEGEQNILSEYLKQPGGRRPPAWTLLDPGIVWLPTQCYSKLEQLRIPPTIAIHHAAYTVGIESKLEQLRYVRKIVSGTDEVTRSR
jgi:hypothetical protein